MKKKLVLKKMTISNLSVQELKDVKGGVSASYTTECAAIYDYITKGDCFNTIGDDHCWTPFKYIGL